jgi:hypothetical protein
MTQGEMVRPGTGREETAGKKWREKTVARNWICFIHQYKTKTTLYDHDKIIFYICKWHTLPQR